MNKKDRAFTLIEMLVVVVVIGIILAIAFPALSNIINSKSKKFYQTHMQGVVEPASALYVEQYKGELDSTNKSCYNIAYQTLIADGLVKETEIKCSGNIIVTKISDNYNYDYGYYLTCVDSNDRKVVTSEQVPGGCLGFNGKFVMDYNVYKDSSETTVYDGSYYTKDAYTKFNSVSPYSSPIDYFEYATSLNGTWKKIASDSNLGAINDIKNFVGTLYVRAVDKDENKSKVVEIPVMMDNTGPTFKITVSGDWLTQTISISNVSDKGVSKLHDKPYSYDNGATWTSNASANFEANGTVSVCVRDSLGNKTCEKNVPITGIDRVVPNPPTVTASDKIPSGKWHNSNFTLTLSGANNASGNTYYYGESEAEVNTKRKENKDGTTISVSTETTSKKYYMMVCSGAGFCSSINSYEVKLDKQTPSCPVFAASDNIGTNKWHKTDFTLSVSGASNISGNTYYLDTSSNPKTARNSLSINSNTSSTTYYTKVCSGSGLCSSACNYVVKLDKTTPSCTITASDNIGSGSWHTKDFTLNVSGANNISGNTYYIDTNNNPTTARNSLSINSNTTSTTYYGRVCSGSGLCSGACGGYVAKLDKTPPVVAISSVSTTINTATVNGSCSDPETNISSIQYSKDGGKTYQNSATFTGLTHGTSYNFVMKCVNGVSLPNTASKTVSTVKVTLGLSSSSGTVIKGKTANVTITGGNYGNLSWSSTNNSVATASISGTTLIINGISVGTATITVTEGAVGLKTTYNVTVKPAYTCSTGTLTQSGNSYICVANNPVSDTSCNSCTYDEYVFGEHSSCGFNTCDVPVTGGAWCTSYESDGNAVSNYWSHIDESEDACRGNYGCTFISCEPDTNKQGWECYTYETVQCGSWSSTCSSPDTFNSSHVEGKDYTSCSTTENKQDSYCGIASCGHYESTYGESCSECGETKTYSCPSGWSQYGSVSNSSSMQCYRAATQAS